MKKYTAAAFALAVFLLAAVLAGCGTSYDRTTLVLNSDGSARQYIVEDADNDTTISELKTYVESSVRAYLAGSEDETIRVEKCDIDRGKVNIELLYSTCADYAAFNDVVCFNGTFSEAEEAGYELDRSYTSAEGGSVSYGNITSEEGEIRVLILNELTSVVLPGTLLAYSDNVVPGEDGSLAAAEDTDESVPEEFRTVNYENAYFIYSVK